MEVMTDTALPTTFAEIRGEFLALEVPERLQLLLEFSNELPELPARYADHPDLLERVAECQSLWFVMTVLTSKRLPPRSVQFTRTS